MPYKDRSKHNAMVKARLRKIRDKNYYDSLTNDDERWRFRINIVNDEFKSRAILPRHIFEWRPIMKQMLKLYFGKKVIRTRNKTELITMSYARDKQTIM